MSSESDGGDSALPSTSSALVSSRKLRPRRNLPPHPPTEATEKVLPTLENDSKNTAGNMDINPEPADESSMAYSRTSLQFKPPRHLLKECIVEAVVEADIAWWRKEENLIENSFEIFVQQDYFVNKYKFLEVLLLPTTDKRIIVLLPSGSAKTVMSVSLEYFFSFKISAEVRKIMQPFYLEFIDKETLQKNEGQYYVLRISFRHLPYSSSSNFLTKLNAYLLEFMKQSEPELFADQKIDKSEDECFFIRYILRRLYENYKRKLILIIDEVDQPATKYLIENASTERIKTMLEEYVAFFNVVTFMSYKNGCVERVILFGIHSPPAVVDIRWWDYVSITQERNWASYFLFTLDEVKQLLTKYGRLAELDKVVQHYGGYNGNHFLPASVVAYVCTSKFAAFKSLRRSYDVLNIDSKMIKSHLLEFIDGKLHEKKFKAGLLGFSRSSMKEDPIPHYAYAGLLCVSFEGTGGLRAGNLENLNIIAFFLESVVDFNYPLLEKVNEAFRNYDLPKLSKAINTIIGTFKPLELCDERCYQIAIKVLFYLALREWTVLSEVDEGTGQPKTEASGRIDLRVSNNNTKLLYIFELKHLSPNRTDISVARLIKDAFKQIEDEGYVSANDEKEFEKIYEVAVVCCGKIVKMQGKLHQASK